MMDKKKKAAAVAAVALAGIIGVGGAYAYFSGQSETVQNQFNIVAGSKDKGGSLEITEDWNEDDAKDLEPGEVVTKDVTITSKVDYDGYVVAKVVIPRIHAMMEGDTDYKYYDVFNLCVEDANEADGVVEGVHSDWKLLSSAVTDEASTYYYGYVNADGTIGGDDMDIFDNGVSSNLFDKIQEQHFDAIESAKSASVDVSAAIIQSINPDTGDEFGNVQAAFDYITSHDNQNSFVVTGNEAVSAEKTVDDSQVSDNKSGYPNLEEVDGYKWLTDGGNASDNASSENTTVTDAE